ncbi:hypothetical protein L2E82_02273 [Cichorium intybus]|uniref:Uncharacterized protein n=1 Tax=Cichorium intybus TaxID=13427 RepID=A0ACB9H2H5_CICIN|nr:hypothetical protein L2E82_02273 [Cichorium intybus]
MEEDQLILSLLNLYLDEQLEKESDPESLKESEPSESAPPNLEDVEEVTGYKFRNKELLKEAFTHGSYKAADCQSYERLEYLGDSVLNHLVAKLHFLAYPEMAPGELTRLRAANVDTEALARAALKYNLQKYLRHQKPLLQAQIREFMEGIEKYPSHSHGMIDPPKVLADILESLIGAIFIDTDYSMDDTWKVVERLLQPLITPENLKLHPVAKFNEACQKMGVKPQAKDFWSKTGEIEIYIDNELIGKGMYKLKKMIAVNRAADDAYKNLFGKKDGGIGG